MNTEQLSEQVLRAVQASKDLAVIVADINASVLNVGEALKVGEKRTIADLSASNVYEIPVNDILGDAIFAEAAKITAKLQSCYSTDLVHMAVGKALMERTSKEFQLAKWTDALHVLVASGFKACPGNELDRAEKSRMGSVRSTKTIAEREKEMPFLTVKAGDAAKKGKMD